MPRLEGRAERGHPSEAHGRVLCEVLAHAIARHFEGRAPVPVGGTRVGAEVQQEHAGRVAAPAGGEHERGEAVDSRLVHVHGPVLQHYRTGSRLARCRCHVQVVPPDLVLQLVETVRGEVRLHFAIRRRRLRRRRRRRRPCGSSRARP